jgi:hypothetical protein
LLVTLIESTRPLLLLRCCAATDTSIFAGLHLPSSGLCAGDDALGMLLLVLLNTLLLLLLLLLFHMLSNIQLPPPIVCRPVCG